MVSTAGGRRWSRGRQLANLAWRLDGAGLSWRTASGEWSRRDEFPGRHDNLAI